MNETHTKPVSPFAKWWALLASWLRSPHLIAKLLILTVLALVVVGIGRSFVSVARDSGPPRGAIYVDSPEVYTRERLVNDRYEQDEWLRDELKKTANMQTRPTGTLETKASNEASAHVSLAGASPQAVDGGTKESAEPKEPAQPEESNASPFDRFLDVSSYRDVIRAELIENQLDDRHDLDGNTVYRLKFDCGVVPVAGNTASAVVEVRMLKVVDPSAIRRDGDAGTNLSDKGQPDGGQKPSAVTQELRSQAGRELYQSWLRETIVETQATLKKRLDDMFAFLSDASKKGAEPEPRAEPSDQLREDLEALRTELQSQDVGLVCTLAESDLVRHAECLMRAPSTGKPAVQANEQKARLRSGFVYHFAKHMTEHFDSLVRFTVDETTDALKAPVLDLLEGKELKNKGALEEEFEKGFVRFQELINPESSEDYAYAVAPKERADSLARVGILADQKRYGLSAAAPVGSAASSADVTAERERLVTASLIERHPRVVGFSNNLDWGASFGWVIGPRFAMPRDAEEEPRFEQHASHHSLSAIVSAPSWWTRVEMQILVYWFDAKAGKCAHEDGVEFTPCPPKQAWGPLSRRVQKVNVRLPGDSRILGERIARRLRKTGADEVKVPAIDKTMEVARVEVGQKAEIIIPGQNLWRSPVVALGGQRAKRIEILPNMNGLVAHFDSIVEPPGWDRKEPYDEARLTVWTSQKQPDSVVGRVVIFPARQATPEANPDAGVPQK